MGIHELIEESKKGFERRSAGSGVVGVAVGVKELLEGLEKEATLTEREALLRSQSGSSRCES